MQTFGPSLTLGGSWQGFDFFGGSLTNDGTTQNGDGSITMAPNPENNFGAQLSNVVIDYSSPPYFRGTAFGGGGYFEAVMSFVYDTAEGAPAFWANDVESMAGSSAGDLTLRQWPGQPAGYGDWIEVDMAEFDANLGSNQYGIAMHNWYGTGQGTSTLGSGSPVTVPGGTDFTQPHKYGFLWVPATSSSQGYAKWFFDDVQIGNTITWNMYDPTLGPAPIDLGRGGSSAYSILDVRHLGLILGNANGDAPPVTVHSVSVWQASTANNITR
jgi:hypothetical protein